MKKILFFLFFCFIFYNIQAIMKSGGCCSKRQKELSSLAFECINK